MPAFHIWTLGCQMNVADSLKLAAGLERAKQLKDGKTPWATQTGGVLRGYRSICTEDGNTPV